MPEDGQEEYLTDQMLADIFWVGKWSDHRELVLLFSLL